MGLCDCRHGKRAGGGLIRQVPGKQKKPGKPIISGFPGIDTKTALQFGRLFLYERLFLNMVLVAVFQPSVALLTIVIGVLSWVSFAKLIYSQTISVKEKEYVEAAKALGNSDGRILVKYILPNVMAPIWITFTLHLGMGILIESGLSFLGVGIQPPTASWGNIINAAQQLMVLRNCPWLWLPPGICLILFIVCINIVGEGLRAAFDPKARI